MLSLEGAIVNENARDNYGRLSDTSSGGGVTRRYCAGAHNMRRGRIDLDAKDKKGRTALLVAQARSCFEERSYPSTVSILQNAGAKADIIIGIRQGKIVRICLFWFIAIPLRW